jgi:hypothetical protein
VRKKVRGVSKIAFVEILVLELVLLTVITSSRVLKELLGFDKQNMDNTRESEELAWQQFRQTLQMSEGDENGKVKSKENDVAMGMSQFGGQRARQNPKLTMRRGDLSAGAPDSRPNYEEYLSPVPTPIPSKYYAVAVGRRVSIFDNWDETKTYVTGFPNATHKSLQIWRRRRSGCMPIITGARRKRVLAKAPAWNL